MRKCKYCDCYARRSGLCAKHGGAPKLCANIDCEKYARKGGYCMKHGGTVNTCSIADCNNIVQKNGLCTKHGAPRIKCSVQGCNNYSRKEGLCYKHNKNPEWRDKQRERQNNYERNRYHNDIHYRTTVLLRRRLHETVSEYKTASALDLVGCDIETLLQHLQSQFETDMHWGNFGEWHIDHIRPCASFDLTDSIQQAECFHYSNLQPLWAKDNLRKGSKII